MNLKAGFNRLPLFWKVYIIIVTLLVAVVGFAELVLENLAKMILTEMYGKFLIWHEIIVWIIGILLPCLICGYIISHRLSQKLENVANVSEALARGNLKVRLPFIDNDNDAFDKLFKSFNEMTDAVDRRLQNERRLLIDVSHELRSPLTRMMIATELLQNQENAPKNTHLLERLEKEIMRMSELTELLLSQSPGHAGKNVSMAEIDLRHTLIELANDFSFQGKPSGKTITCRVPDELKMKGNKLLLQQMIGNLLANALFYTPDRSEVFLSAAAHENELEIIIRDYGPGVPEESLDDIFRAFYRVNSSRSRQDGGAGLGLALAREAALAHGGDISAKNAQPGLEMTIMLPLNSKDDK